MSNPFADTEGGEDMAIFRRNTSRDASESAPLERDQPPAGVVIHEPTDPRGLSTDRAFGEGSAGACCGLAAYVAAADGAQNALSDLAGALAPRPKSARKVEVPNFVGMKASEVFWIAAKGGVRIEFVEISPNPAPVDGLIVQQEFPPRTIVRRDSVVRLGVTHEYPDQRRLGPHETRLGPRATW